MRSFGLFSSETAPLRGNNLLDALCGQLETMLSFQPGERDLVMLQHKFVVEWKDGKKVSSFRCPMIPEISELTFMDQDTITSTLELLGDPKGFSAMSKSVGLTCGIATQLLLDGHSALNRPGMVAPYDKAICDPIRELLEREGIKVVEKIL